MAGNSWLEGGPKQQGAIPELNQKEGFPGVEVAAEQGRHWLGKMLCLPNGTHTRCCLTLPPPLLVPLEFVPFALEPLS